LSNQNQINQIWVLPLRCSTGIVAGKVITMINDAHRYAIREWNLTIGALLAQGVINGVVEAGLEGDEDVGNVGNVENVDTNNDIMYDFSSKLNDIEADLSKKQDDFLQGLDLTTVVSETSLVDVQIEKKNIFDTKNDQVSPQLSTTSTPTPLPSLSTELSGNGIDLTPLTNPVDEISIISVDILSLSSTSVVLPDEKPPQQDRISPSLSKMSELSNQTVSDELTQNEGVIDRTTVSLQLAEDQLNPEMNNDDTSIQSERVNLSPHSAQSPSDYDSSVPTHDVKQNDKNPLSPDEATIKTPSLPEFDDIVSPLDTHPVHDTPVDDIPVDDTPLLPVDTTPKGDIDNEDDNDDNDDNGDVGGEGAVKGTKKKKVKVVKKIIKKGKKQ
jgi:hypothetical protein